jgi:hypothetical protein
MFLLQIYFMGDQCPILSLMALFLILENIPREFKYI